MSHNLNEQYFKTRKEHENSHNKRGYIIWIILGLGVISFFVVSEIRGNRKIEQKKTEVLKSWLETGTLSSSDTLIKSKATGTQILVLKNCTYKEFDNTFAAFRTTGLTYLTKRIIADADFPSAFRQWELFVSNNSKCIYSNVKLDSINGLRIETADFTFKIPDNAQEGKGKLRLVRKGGLIYALEIMSTGNNWDQDQSDITRIENSFEIQ